MTERSYNVNIHGGNNQNSFGDHGQFTQNIASDATPFDSFLTNLSKEIGESQVEAEVLEPLRQIGTQLPPSDEAETQSLKTEIMQYVARLEPYVPIIRKTLAAFAEGALNSLPPPAGWVINGMIEVVRDARRD